MLSFEKGCSVYLACGCTDLRKGFSGLVALVSLKFQLDPYSKSMFAFCNRSRSLLKILRWNGSGFWLLTKRLERGTFAWPRTKEEVKQVSMREMEWLIEGLSLEQGRALSFMPIFKIFQYSYMSNLM